MYLVGFNKGYTDACGKRQTHAIDPSFGINFARYLVIYRPATEGIADAQTYLKTHDCERAFPLLERVTEEEVDQAQREPNPEDRAKFQLLTRLEPPRAQAAANWWESLLGKWVDPNLGVRMTFDVREGSKFANLGGPNWTLHYDTPDFGGGDIMTTVTDAASGAEVVFYDCTDEIRLRIRPAWCRSREDDHQAVATRNADGSLDVTFRGYVAWKNVWSQHSFHLVHQP